jgi:SHS2 domain-containing protein
MPYEFLEDIATSDIAFRARGDSLEETFIAAADAVMNVMIEDLGSIRFKETRSIHLENDELDMLLFDLMQEIIYFKDAEILLLRIRQIQIRTNSAYLLDAIASGEKLDPQRHLQRVDVKAVTLHRFNLLETEHGWEAEVILDI